MNYVTYFRAGGNLIRCDLQADDALHAQLLTYRVICEQKLKPTGPVLVSIQGGRAA